MKGIWGGVEWLFQPGRLFKFFDGPQHNLADDGQAQGTALVHGVLGGMPVTPIRRCGCCRAIVEVDDIDGGDARIHKGHVVIIVSALLVKEILAVAQPLGGLENFVGQPWS